MKYEDMSDFEINCAVAVALDLNEHLFFPSGVDDFDSDTDDSDMGPVWQTRMPFVKGFRPSNGNLFNPCNNIDIAWRIITRNHISIECRHTLTYRAYHSASFTESTHENPLRAAMIVFLKMQEKAQRFTNYTAPLTGGITQRRCGYCARRPVRT